ncbi:unnamed protein product, partial [Ixodes pacificus]
MTGRRRDKRDGFCFVPNCSSGYRSCKEARSLFRVPLEADRREEWSRNIKRGDRALHECSVVCERHFEPRFIQRSFQMTINGKVVEIPRDRPLLTKDAIPTIFPDAPKYLSKSLPKIRKERNLSDQVFPNSKRRREDNMLPEAASNDVGLPNDLVKDSFSGLTRPNVWSEIFLPCAEDSFLYAECEADAVEQSKIAVKKQVRITMRAGGTAATADVLIRGKKLRQEVLATREEAEALINNVSQLALCPGTGIEPLTDKCPSFNGAFFSRNCAVVIADNLRACMHCRYQRKLILNQLSRRR